MDLLKLLCFSIVLFGCILPSRIFDLKFLPIHKSLVVKIDRNSPARAALLDINYDLQLDGKNQKISSAKQVILVSAGSSLTSRIPAAIETKVVLSSMRIQAPEELRDQHWLNELSYQQKTRVRLAEESNNFITDTLPRLDTTEKLVSSEASEELKDDYGRRIRGPIEVVGGLAITDELYLEVRRKQEGIVKESGRVNLKSGIYELAVEDFSGVIEGRLVSNSGHVLGEASVRIEQLKGARGLLSGPKLEVAPLQNRGGGIASVYGTPGKSAAPVGTSISAFQGGVSQKVSSNKQSEEEPGYSIAKVAANSTTVIRAAAAGFYQTASLSVKQKGNILMFPNSMIRALNGIVTGRDLSDGELSELSIVWGTTIVDGKAIAGVSVEAEGHPEYQVIYFNSLMIPDLSLKATSENGLFAFLDLAEGFVALRANRGNSFFGYNNVVIEKGSVALTSIEHSIRKQAVPVRLYDAFSGRPLPGVLAVQGSEESLNIENGSGMSTLSSINRLGIVQYTSSDADYISARYQYRDSDSFIHIAAIPWRWLLTAKSRLRITETPNSGVVVGFVPDFDFEVFVANIDKTSGTRIEYFDMSGNWINQSTGKSGGGFAIFNLPEDTHEIVVISKSTERIHSQVVPVDANSLSVLSFLE